MSFYRTHFLYIPLFFLIFSLGACKGKKSGQENQIGRAAPAFTLKDLNGTPHSLENFRGKVVLLRFWATRCESCKVEMPRLENSYRKLLTSGMMVLAVNVEDPADKAAEFARELRLTYPILIDEGGRITKLYQVYGVPTSFLIDKGGAVRERVYGDLAEEAIDKLVRPFL